MFINESVLIDLNLNCQLIMFWTFYYYELLELACDISDSTNHFGQFGVDIQYLFQTTVMIFRQSKFILDISNHFPIFM